MDAVLMRSQAGLVPADDDTREWFARLELGAQLRAKVTQDRNPQFHRKWFALVQLAFEHWSDTAEPVKYKDIDVQPDFERFRKDITILAGKFHYVTNLRGEVRAEADSISFGKMSQQDFERLYSQTISVLIGRVFKGPQWSESHVRALVDEIAGFA